LKSYSRFIGLGAYLPNQKMTNYDLEKIVETNNEWIVRRTGVKERRISEKEEFASDMAVRAVENLIEKNHVCVGDVDMIIVTTFTPDYFTPTVSALVQSHFGIKAAGTMDLSAGCTGAMYGLCVADSLISAEHSNKVLVVAAETISKYLDYTDRNTCILFGDAAVAILMEKSKKTGSFLASYFATDGAFAKSATCSNLSQSVNGEKIVKERLFEQDGRSLYEYVVKNIPVGISILLEKANLTLDDIDWFVPHSANLRMVEALCKRINMPIEKTLVSNEFYGNTSSASIPLAMWMALETSKIKPGDILLLYGYGAGLTHGGVIVEWN
jgi:3-oxoacyl-[acyl-carrier-protein] synthase-3